MKGAAAAKFFYFLTKNFGGDLVDIFVGLFLLAVFVGLGAIAGAGLGLVVAKLSGDDAGDDIAGGAIVGAIGMLILIFVV